MSVCSRCARSAAALARATWYPMSDRNMLSLSLRGYFVVNWGDL